MPRRSNQVLAVSVSEDIVPIAELKAHLSEVVRGLPARRRPVVVTQNGKAAAVLLSPVEFDRLTYESRVATAVEEGLDDASHGRVLSDEALGELADERYGPARRRRAKRR